MTKLPTKKETLIALAGQPNCGKSTIFNMLTGARQYVANYPGVTVDKMYGSCFVNDQKITVVDLPGTYAFTSYSLEEKAAREFIVFDKPDVIVAVVDSSTLDKGLYFLLQLLEMGRPVIVALNMIDKAHRRGLQPSPEKLSELLNVPVIALQATKKESTKELLDLIGKEIAKGQSSFDYNFAYGEITPYVEKLAKAIEETASFKDYNSTWLALKIFEEDPAIMELIAKDTEQSSLIDETLKNLTAKISEKFTDRPVTMLAHERHKKARELRQLVLQDDNTDTQDASIYRKSLTDKIDSVLCHRILGPICLVLVLFIFYQVSITWGNELAAMAWPFWAKIESLTAKMLPMENFLFDPFFTSFGAWLIKSVTTVMNYLPIFFLMFSFVAILEDSGYLARIAFVLDRIFNTFGLHGQSTLPLILGGIYVGGCAIPGVVATRAIPDNRARMATIMIVPMMNCLAKVPLYFMLIGIFFTDTAGSAMFFMGTITLILGLIVAKIMSLTILRGYQPAPFIIELPSYHMPTARNVLREAIIRMLTFIQKIVTVVVTVAAVVFILISYPSLSDEREAFYLSKQEAAEKAFTDAASKTDYADKISGADIVPLIYYQAELREMKVGKSPEEAKAINEEQLVKNPEYASIVLRRGDAGRKLATALRRADSARKNLRRQYRTERFENSYLGRAGKALEPVTAWAGFNWRINVALLSALAAKENSAATLGAIYGIDGTTTAESFAQQESSLTPLHALALMLFMALYPPCLAAAVMVKTQAGSVKWMIFAAIFQITIGLCIASLVFSVGSALSLTGVQAMWSLYAFCLVLLLVVGLIPHAKPRETKPFLREEKSS